MQAVIPLLLFHQVILCTSMKINHTENPTLSNYEDDTTELTTSTLHLVIPNLNKNMIKDTMRRKNNKTLKMRKRQKRSIGSLKINNFLRQDIEEVQSAPPSFVALVFIDLIAALFTINAIAALLFVASR